MKDFFPLMFLASLIAATVVTLMFCAYFWIIELIS